MAFALLISAIGKMRGPEAALADHYAGRLRWPLTQHESESSRAVTAQARRMAEAETLLKPVPGGWPLVMLDETGKDLGSEAFAARLGQWQDEGLPGVAFLIGGPDGLDPDLRARASLALAFGRATWPHLLVRGMLLEQLYRARTILDGHPYHRGG